MSLTKLEIGLVQLPNENHFIQLLLIYIIYKLFHYLISSKQIDLFGSAVLLLAHAIAFSPIEFPLNR